MDRQAKWIQSAADLSVAEFRKEFALAAAPGTASLSICGLGFYEAKINGRPVTDHLLTPPFTAYDKRAYYDEYDVTALLQPGPNEITVLVGPGWFRQTAPDAWEFEHATWRAPLQLIAQLDVDGECALHTGSDWQSRGSRLVFSQLREGETYDATLPEAAWGGTIVARGPGGVLRKYDGPAVEIEEILEPVSATAAGGGTVYDFGVNLAGNCEITVIGPRGTKVSMQYSEKIAADGDIDCSNINSLVFSPRFQTDEYILAGEGEETWHSRFTYNGFRYVKVVGAAQVIALRGRCYHTRLDEIGGFECDNALINGIQRALLRSTKTNFHHMPTDCPHREKNGWTGDAHLSCEQALINLDVAPAYRKWLRDMADVQRPNGALPGILPTSVWGYNWGNGVTWDMVAVVIPWEAYMATGDESFLRDSFPMMEKYVDYMTSIAENGISTIGLGDWCAPKEARETCTPALLTGMAIRVYDLMEKICTAAGMGDPAKYAALSAETREAFRREFFGKADETITYLAMLLWLNLADDPAEVTRRLVQELAAHDNHLYVGIFGAKFLLDVLTDNGRFDLAWEIANQTDYPSYGLMLSSGHGTLWEDFAGESSLNHHMFSPIGAWFHKAIAGVRVVEAGWKKVRVAPHIPAEMKFFRAWHTAPQGRFEVLWKDGLLTVTAPENMEIDIDAAVPSRLLRS